MPGGRGEGGHGSNGGRSRRGIGMGRLMSQIGAMSTTSDMSTAAEARIAMFGSSVGARVRTPRDPEGSAVAEFEQVYVDNADLVMAYFARRYGEPQVVADLTSETFVRAAGGFATFDPDRGSARAWLFGIAANVFARHCSQSAEARDAAVRLAAQRPLDADETDELTEKIDAQRAGRELMEHCACLTWNGLRLSWSTSQG